jgi:hypothetical protein
MMTTPKFDKTFCSQCGQEFGPGDHGFSHCSDHQGKIIGQGGPLSALQETAPSAGEPKRYNTGGFGAGMHKSKKGEWVRFEDYDALAADLARVCQERACYRAVCEGMEFERLDDMPGKGVEFCRRIGDVAKQEIFGLKRRAEEAEQAREAAEKDKERLDLLDSKWMDGIHVEVYGKRRGEHWADARREATVYLGSKEFKGDTVRAAIDAAGSQGK